ncbi:ATP-binding protein [Streptomyces sp. HNM0575]|uniref:ATP-binding protein n=1 Tax=Streptomyces sp. HNM0575 TaxID=2716338 RepID=UPI00145DA62C|nr:ATP-binding protein [Streptomyces sp. HNM0575]NLU72264.1 ATP-binding protein [Streptomyces sp. HNM0575]
MPARIQARSEARQTFRDQQPVTVRVFAQRFSATPRGARLARLLALFQLDAWDVPYGSTASDDAAAIVAELAANAVTHGRVPGRDFRLGLALAPYDGLRIEVTDTRDEARPSPVQGDPSDPEAEAGRGLFLVDALASDWGVRERVGGGPGKTVWARLKLE